MLTDLIKEARRGHSPRWWVRRAAIYGAIGPYQRWRFEGGVELVDEEWDTLLVLDACRADLFEAVADVGSFDRYERVDSDASATKEWTEHHFAGESFGDTVYVSANPYTSKLAADSFHALVPVWEDGFDRDSGTVLPETVTERAREAAERYPHKRLIVHYMQPHHPFLHPDWGNEYFHNPEEGTDPWEQLEEGDATYEAVWAGYADNLERVLGPARRLADDLAGRTVITSDHGNMLGERLSPFPVRGYGHSIGLRAPELVSVPWAVVDGEARDVTAGDTGVTESESDAIEERLQHLGYR